MNIIWIFIYIMLMLLILSVSLGLLLIFISYIEEKFNIILKCKYIKVKKINIPFIFIKKLKYQELPVYIIPIIELDSSKVIVVEE
jgi:hypothetical protein